MVMLRRDYLSGKYKYTDEEEKELIDICKQEIANYENNFFMGVEDDSDKMFLLLNVKCVNKWNSKQRKKRREQ